MVINHSFIKWFTLFDLDAAISLEVPEFSFVGSNPNFSTSYFQPLTTDFILPITVE